MFGAAALLALGAAGLRAAGLLALGATGLGATGLERRPPSRPYFFICSLSSFICSTISSALYIATSF